MGGGVGDVVGSAAVAVVVALLGLLAITAYRMSRRDCVCVLTILLVAVLLVPQWMVVAGPLKSLGSPSTLVGAFAIGYAVRFRRRGRLATRPANPLTYVLAAYAATTVLSFAATGLRPLTDMEARGGVRSLVPTLIALGLALVVLRTLRTVEEIERLMWRLVVIGAVAAAIGIAEYSLPGFQYGDLFDVPGLVANNEAVGGERSGFDRIHGAAAHPIEYSVSLAAISPIALHFALHHRRSSMIDWLPFILIAASVPLAISRAGLLAMVVALIVYACALPPRLRFNTLVLFVVGAGVFAAVRPGVLGTLRSLMFVGTTDPSIAGRTEDYDRVLGLLRGFELMGRGIGTFQPVQYFFLDNQYLTTALEAGVLGLASLVAFAILAPMLANSARAGAPDAVFRSLAGALTGSLTALLFTAGTFDQNAFRQTLFLWFLLAGCAGALWSKSRVGTTAPAPHPDSVSSTRSGS